MPIPASSLKSAREALTLLKAECFGCHNPEKNKGGLILTTREGLMKGGGSEGGPVVVPGHAESSRLIAALAADADPHMPPKRQLSSVQIGVLRRWIADGAAWDATALRDESADAPVAMSALPDGYRPAFALALSPDGRFLAAARGGRLTIYQVGATNLVLEGSTQAHDDAIQSIAWSSDGARLASAGMQRVAMWSARGLQKVREWRRGITGRVTAMQFLPDDQTLLIADGGFGQPGMLRLLPVASDAKAAVQSWVAHRDTIFDLQLSRDGKQCVTAGGDKLIKIWDLGARRETATLEGHNSQVLTVAFNTNATQVASGGADKEMKIWDVSTREKITSLGQHTAAISKLAWLSETQALFAVREDGVVLRFTDIKAHTGEQSSESGREQRIGALESAGFALAATRDRNRVFAAGEDGRVFMWDGDGKLLAKAPSSGIEAERRSIVVSPTAPGRSPASGAPQGIAAARSEVRRARPSEAPFDPASVETLSLSPPRIVLAAGAAPHGVAVSARTQDGFEVDVTSSARFMASPGAPFDVGVYGAVRPLRPGKGRLKTHFAGKSAEIEIEVLGAGTDDSAGVAPPASFARDVLPALSKAGCNAGACHAKPDGQNGFKLSVFSYDPQSDYAEIVREDRGRRVFPAAPEESLLLRKPTGLLPHEGGVRFEPGSPTYNLIAQWIRDGMVFSRPQEPALESIEVFPKERRYRKGASQTLLAQARYSDGSTRDITGLAAFASSDKEIVRVDDAGRLAMGNLPGQGVVVARYMGFVADSQVLIPADALFPESVYAALPRQNFIDDLAYAQFQRLGLLPSELCSDEEFLRRAKLDALGLLPTPEEAREFAADDSKDKRTRLIDRLLSDPAYADFWANKWADLLRPNPDRVGVKSIFTLDQWLRESFQENKPYDRFVREILTAEGMNHREGPAVIYRDRREPADLTTMFSQLFLGVRLECARCHHHPNEKWAQEDFYQFAAYFAQLKQKGAGLSPPISAGMETFYYSPGGEVRHPVSGKVMAPKAPDGPVAKPSASDPRSALASWLTDRGNPFFAKAAVNRVWASFFGRGLVEPVDDFRISNPCVNTALLSALAETFVGERYDLKALMRTLMGSRLYQLSATPNSSNGNDTRNFSRAYRRRLPAEVLLDAVADVTGIPETFAAMPPGARAVQTWSYKIDSQFLDAFGRPNSSSDCPCERDSHTSVVQSLHMMHSKGLQAKLSHPQGRTRELAGSARTSVEIVTELYWMTLSRGPRPRELRTALEAYGAPGATRQTATEDVLWALLNSAEFVFNR